MFEARSVVFIHPVYLMLDASESMQRPISGDRTSMDIFVPLLDSLVLELSDLHAIRSMVWVSVLAFSDRVEILRELLPLQRYHTPRAPARGTETNYTEALRFLARQCPADRQRIEYVHHQRNEQARVARPLIFIVTDGAPFAHGRDQPDADWLAARTDLVGPPTQARIAAVSHRAEFESILWQLATGRDNDRNAFLARPNMPPDRLAASVRQCIVNSIGNSIRRGELVMHEPDGMRRARQHVQS